MINETFDWTKRSMVGDVLEPETLYQTCHYCMQQKGNAGPSIVRTLLEGIPETGMSVEDAEDHIKEIAATLFLGE